MNSTNAVIMGIKGQTVCRPTTWTDIAKFFAFNYGLHVFTVISAPGSGGAHTTITAIFALLMPFTGILTALEVIFRWRIKRLDDLHTAQRAGALCMVVPDLPDLPADFERRVKYVNPANTKVHGQYPLSASFPSRTSVDGNEGQAPVNCRLMVVPKTFTIAPLRNSGSTPVQLTYNYNIFKAFAAVTQAMYGSFELYQASERQLPKFGYAAYSLSVIPYVLMSLLNLLAAVCEPQYPSMFLVLYRGVGDQPQTPEDSSVTGLTLQPLSSDGLAPVASELEGDDDTFTVDEQETHVSGAVGEAYGDLSGDLTGYRHSILYTRTQHFAGLPRWIKWIILPRFTWIAKLVVYFFAAVPPIIILLLTGFDNGQSTESQRAWMIASLAVGEAYGVSFYSLRTTIERTVEDCLVLGLGFIVGTAVIGGFVVIGQMMMHDEVCKVL